LGYFIGVIGISSKEPADGGRIYEKEQAYRAIFSGMISINQAVG
jgi:hypothetical protein